MRLVDVREEVELISEAIARARGATSLGTTTTHDLAAIFRGAPETVSWESWSLVSEAAASAEGKRAQRLKALRHHLFRLLEQATTAEASSQRLEVETRLLPGAESSDQTALRVALAELGSVDNRDKRLGLERRVMESLERSASPYALELEALQSVAQKAGFSSTMQAHAALGELELSTLAEDAQAFLNATDAMYDDVLSWWMRRTLGMRLFPHGAERHDLLYVLALRAFEGVFPARRDLTRLGARLDRMGLVPGAEGRIHVDLENRATKDPAAVSFAVTAPREVWLSVRGERGFDLTRRFLAGLGAAQHWANIDPARPFEDRIAGDSAIPFGVGEAFSGNLMAPVWLRKVLDADAPDLPRLIALAFLGRARFAAATLLHSMQVDSDGTTAGQPKLYSERMSQVMRVEWPSASWLLDADLRHSTSKLRAIAWGHALRAHLIEQFDEDWWANPQAGAFLLKLFDEGQFPSVAELSARFATGPVTMERLAASFERVLM